MDYLPAWPLEISPILAFGLILLIGAMGGYFSHRISWLPSITGFMAAGFLCGPSVLGLLSHEAIVEARVFVEVGLALILYRLGLSLDLTHILRSPRLLLTSVVESLATFVLVFFVLLAFDVPGPVAALISAITISSSPAVLLHVANEVGASGIVTESAKTLVALNNLISFMAYSTILPFMHYTSGSDWQTILFQPLYQLAGSVLLGIVLALILHALAVKTHAASQYKLALVIGTALVALGLANELQLSPLFTPLVIGVIVKTLEHESVVSSLEFGSAFELFFIVLFVFAGAELHVQELILFAPAVLALVLVRSLAKVLGVTAFSFVFREPARRGISSGLLLVPMAGLAVGLVLNSSSLFPQHAATITAFIVGAVAVFETFGPPIAAFAFRFAGEAGRMERNDGVVMAEAQTQTEQSTSREPGH